jgi:Ternary complex associated domain 9
MGFPRSRAEEYTSDSRRRACPVLYPSATRIYLPEAYSPAQRWPLLLYLIGIVIARSLWTANPPEEHREILERLCSFSSFTWIKVDTRGFAYPQDFESICAKTRFRGRRVSEVSSSHSCDIAETDIPALDHAAYALQETPEAQLHPADIDPEVARLLCAAVARRVDDRNFPSTVHVKQIGIKTISGGCSGARVIQLQPDDRGSPLVAKVDDISVLRDEMERFNQFVKPIDENLDPELHYHCGRGAIVFGLLQNPNAPQHPAPTLRQRLDDFAASECGARSPELNEGDVRIVIEKCTEKIKRINEKPCPVTTFPPKTWMKIDALEALESNGVGWMFDALPDGSDPRTAAREAIKALQHTRSPATVHGDVHLRNILIRDREPFLIDYANSGPGHPFFDLVRFESALMFRFYRLTSSEERLKHLFASLDNASLTVDRLKSEWKPETGPALNRLVLFAAIQCRSICHDLARQYQLPWCDYHAVKLVVACQSLSMPDLQTGVVRARLWADAHGFRATRQPVQPTANALDVSALVST